MFPWLTFPRLSVDSLFQARPGIQVASSKYAHWDPSVPLAVWTYGFSHQFERKQGKKWKSSCTFWWLLPGVQWRETISHLWALWFYQAWYWFDLFHLFGTCSLFRHIVYFMLSSKYYPHHIPQQHHHHSKKKEEEIPL